MSQRVLVPLRWGDLDAQGHINNAAFVDYLQEARADFILDKPIQSMLDTGVIVIKQQIEYQAPAYFQTVPLAVDIWLSHVSGARFTFAYKLWQGERQVAEARTCLCPYDLEQSRPRALTADERAWMTSQLEPAEPFRPVARRPLNARARSAPMRVRWSDIDSYGHVNNVLFFNYIMEGRIAFTAAGSPSTDETDESVEPEALWLIVRQDVDYLKPISFRTEPYTVRTGVAKMGTTSLTFCSEIVDPAHRQRFATGSTVAVHADAAGHPAEIPAAVKAELEPYRL